MVPALSVITRHPEEAPRMPDARPADPTAPDPVHEIARELLNILPFGAGVDALDRCPRLGDMIGDGVRTRAALVEAIESFPDRVDVADHHLDPLAPGLVRHMLHVLLATRDLGWPGTDAPLSVRRVAAADLFFDATQTVLADDDWKGPDGVEFALLTALAARLCRTGPRGAPGRPDAAAPGGRARDAGSERLGHLHRVHRPRGL
jgi:hypothetical protein